MYRLVGFVRACLRGLDVSCRCRRTDASSPERVVATGPTSVFLLPLEHPWPFVLPRRPSACHTNHGRSQRHPSLEDLASQTVVCDVEGALLRTSSTFPYFMLVALEAGGFLRGLLLLLLHPLISCLGHEVGIRIMVMVCFFGLRKEDFRVGRAALPKFFLEQVGLEGFEVLRRGGRRVCVSSMPTVMVEGFLKEYLDVEVVLGRELKLLGGYYTGLMEDRVIGFGHVDLAHHQLFTHCKEVCLVGEAEKRRWHPLPSSQYPKPLVFHDGRIAFTPDAISTLCMFLWFPLGFALAFARALVFLCLPYALCVPLLAFLGMHSRLITSDDKEERRGDGSQLYICNHRTLLDGLYISAALGRHLTATTYSVSRISEWFSPIRTVRLTRNREEDAARMKKLVQEGDLLVCPEGTTCREPYLLRFSQLVAEISREVVPVALESWVSMFYGTSTGKLKFLDPLYFLMNPFPCYEVEFMARVATGAIGGKECSSYEMANHLQAEIGTRLGFQCTSLTRKDKYLLLAGNEGTI
ncbi:glycerol-3-phosphate acyltransferase [Musa troglodytarum]|uniref:Glycerol-3-phosphate acyltransferase n=4 Tax=Musa troglodytarum TaxID=320322 RepID=A0A9E7FTZ1_9LILI|nr:glycerol-3-phosphate acyltransferase [Musa troglodytarum]